jgi:hypothetical protein
MHVNLANLLLRDSELCHSVSVHAISFGKSAGVALKSHILLIHCTFWWIYLDTWSSFALVSWWRCEPADKRNSGQTIVSLYLLVFPTKSQAIVFYCFAHATYDHFFICQAPFYIFFLLRVKQSCQTLTSKLLMVSITVFIRNWQWIMHGSCCQRGIQYYSL